MRQYQAAVAGFATESSVKSRWDQNKRQLCSTNSESEKDSVRRKSELSHSSISPPAPFLPAFLPQPHTSNFSTGAGMLLTMAPASAPCRQPLLQAELLIKGAGDLGSVYSESICYA